MPGILLPTEHADNTRRSHYEKLREHARQQWAKFQNLAPAPRALIRRAFADLKDDDPHLVARATLFNAYLERMQRCQLTAPCKVIGCRKCSKKVVFDIADRIAAIASCYSITRQGYVVALSLKPKAWQSQTKPTKDELEKALTLLTNVAEQIPEIDGLTFSIDVSKEQLSNEYFYHIHGTLLTTTKNLSALDLQLTQILEVQGFPCNTWMDLVKPRQNQKAQPSNHQFLTHRDMCAWSCYQLKLHNGDKLPAKDFIDLQMDLFDIAIRRHTGKFSVLETGTTSFDYQKAITEISSLSEQLACTVSPTNPPGPASYHQAVTYFKDAIKWLALDHRSSTRRLVAFDRSPDKHSQLAGICALLANIVNLRLRMATNFAKYGNDELSNDAQDRCLMQANHLKAQLLKYNEQWPAILSHENVDHLDWDGYWEAVQVYLDKTNLLPISR